MVGDSGLDIPVGSIRMSSPDAGPAYHLVSANDIEYLPSPEVSRPGSSDYNGSAREEKMRCSTRRMSARLHHEATRTWHEVGHHILHSLPFQSAMALAILGNAIVIGLETDLPEWGQYWSLVENSFLFVFTIELVCRIAIVRPAVYFDIADPDIIWNSFDFSIVLLGLCDAASHAISPHKSRGNVATLFRMIRLLRILRIFKIIRFLKQLYLLAYGFVEAAQAVFWVSVLMVFVLYICSIVLVRTIGQLPDADEHAAFFHKYYGSVVRAMLTLFCLMSNPDMGPYEGMRSDFPGLTLFLLAFIIFGSFGMIALLTGVISESMFEKNALRMDSDRLDREQRRKGLVNDLADIYESLPIDHNVGEEASKDQIMDLLPAVVELFTDCNIAYVQHDVEQVVEVMDYDDSQTISNEEFVHGITSIAEEIRPMSIAELFHSVSIIRAKIMKMEDMMSTMFVREAGTQEMADGKAGNRRGSRVSLVPSHMHPDCQQLGELQRQLQDISSSQIEGAAESKRILQMLQTITGQDSCSFSGAAPTTTVPVTGEASSHTVGSDLWLQEVASCQIQPLASMNDTRPLELGAQELCVPIGPLELGAKDALDEAETLVRKLASKELLQKLASASKELLLTLAYKDFEGLHSEYQLNSHETCAQRWAREPAMSSSSQCKTNSVSVQEPIATNSITAETVACAGGRDPRDTPSRPERLAEVFKRSSMKVPLLASTPKLRDPSVGSSTSMASVACAELNLGVRAAE